jgi:signal transduction histidine kinase
MGYSIRHYVQRGSLILVGAVLVVSVVAIVMITHTGNYAMIFVAALVALMGLMILYYLHRFQRIVFLPLTQVAGTMKRVTVYKDFSLRATSGSEILVPKEIDALIDSFNSMLKEIEDREKKLLRKTTELEKAKQAAEAANIAKSQFLANISHELRTPLNAIIGFSSMMRDGQYGPLEARYQAYTVDIVDSANHLLNIINDILDLSKAEAGKLTIQYEQVVVPKIIDKAVNMLTERARQGEVTLQSNITEQLPKMVGDKVRLLQILLNLVSNAVKFTKPGGSVTIYATAEAGSQHTHYFTFLVEDTGIGMSEVEIDHAFQSFQQVEQGLNRKFEGTGLGLPLTKKLVELHNGTLRLESERGKGTKAIVHIVSDPALLD